MVAHPLLLPVVTGAQCLKSRRDPNTGLSRVLGLPLDNALMAASTGVTPASGLPVKGGSKEQGARKVTGYFSFTRNSVKPHNNLTTLLGPCPPSPSSLSCTLASQFLGPWAERKSLPPVPNKQWSFGQPKEEAGKMCFPYCLR